MVTTRTYVDDIHTKNRIPLCEAARDCDQPALGVVPRPTRHEDEDNYAVAPLTPICIHCCRERRIHIIQGFGVLPGFEEAQR